MAPNGIFKQYCNCTDLCSWDLDKLQLENCIFEALFWRHYAEVSLWGNDMGRVAHPYTPATPVWLGKRPSGHLMPSVISMFLSITWDFKGWEIPPTAKHPLLTIKSPTTLRHNTFRLQAFSCSGGKTSLISYWLFALSMQPHANLPPSIRVRPDSVLWKLPNRKSNKLYLQCHLTPPEYSLWPRLTMLPGVSAPNLSLLSFFWVFGIQGLNLTSKAFPYYRRM